jgi:hypothetical protein
MTATFAPNGLTPSRIRGGAPNSNGSNEYPIASGTAASIYTGQPVRVSVGNIVALTSAGEATIGVFQGCRYVENGEQKFKAYWPGGTSATNAVGYVIDNPNQVYVIQADASVTAGVVGNNISFGAVDLKVIRVVDEPGNVTGDAATKIEVLLNLHADNFRQVYVTAPVTATAGN